MSLQRREGGRRCGMEWVKTKVDERRRRYMNREGAIKREREGRIEKWKV